MSWPNGVDPWYLANTTDNNARRVYYNITGTPTQVCDGTAASWPTMQSTIQNRLAVASPIWMDLIAQVNGNNLNLTAKCVTSQSITGNYVIQMVLMERYKFLVSPNGMNDHYHPMVKMAPTASGQTFSAPTPGDTITYNASFTLSPSWSITNLDIAAFVQNNSNHEVLQSRCEQIPVNFPGLVYQSNTLTDNGNNDGRAEPGETASMYITLANGQFFQTATNVVGTLSTTDPSLTVTTPTVNFPSINPGGTGTNVNPFVFMVSTTAQPHLATLHLSVVADPGQTPYSTDFQIYIGWPQVYLMDDDGMGIFEDYYEPILDSLGITYEHHDVNLQGIPDTTHIGSYDNMVWFTGFVSTNVLNAQKQSLIQYYLSMGGHLFINGQNIAQYLNTSAPTFLQNTLHAGFSISNTQIRLLSGVAGNPVGDGLNLDINAGGSGSGSATHPDGISVLAPAQEAFIYQASAYRGGLTYIGPNNEKLVYFSFPFEAISGQNSTANHYQMMSAIMDWFGVSPPPPPAALDVTLTPVNPPITVPANGGSFQFNAAVMRVLGPQAPFYGWARMKYPDGTYSNPTLGPVQINPPVGVSVSRLRIQNIPASHPAGVTTYLGYANTTVTYPAIDSSFFTFTKLATADDGPWVNNNNCFGEPFPGEIMTSTPSDFGLVNVSPNPFNPATAISYQLSVLSHISLKVYDTAGRVVAELVNGMQESGSHQVTFDGSGLASGLYFVQLQTGDFSATQKMILLK
jgi:hypothetical protein